MDIFSAPKRTPDDAIKTPYLLGSESAQARLDQAHQIEKKLFEDFIQTIYKKFEQKVFKCSYTCIAKAQTYQAIRICQDECTVGIKKFSSVVDAEMLEMQKLLSECLADAEQLPNGLQQVYRCHDLYVKGFSALKKSIFEESLFYQ